MPESPLLEVISVSPFDSKTIENCGADRVELVSALEIGGLTPSNTIIRKSLECVDIPTMVMIRHHNNGFVHSQEEKSLFYDDIQNCKQLGVRGIVLGGIDSKGNIDVQLCKESIDRASKMSITFHKAFDQVNNIVEAYDSLKNIGISRVLTQGGQSTIQINYKLLKSIIDKSKSEEQNCPKVLLGGGVNLSNLNEILTMTGTQEIHIGTCVRENKYGKVSEEKLKEFVECLKK